MPAPEPSPAAPEPFPTAQDHVRGDPAAPVSVVEYGDYECPYCAAAAPVLRELVETSGGQVRLAFRNFPLPDVHPYALTAALAAEAVAPFGVFWEMHDVLFARQNHLSDADLARYAQSLGVDGAAVVGDAAQPFGDKVEADYASGAALGVRGTPWLFLDGVPYQGRLGLAELRAAAGALARPRGLPPRPRWKRG